MYLVELSDIDLFVSSLFFLCRIRGNIQNGVLHLKAYLHSYEQNAKHGAEFKQLNSELLKYFNRAEETMQILDGLFIERKAKIGSANFLFI